MNFAMAKHAMTLALAMGPLAAWPSLGAESVGSSASGRAAPSANSWVEVSTTSKPLQAFCDLRYQRVTDEFLMWGRIGGHAYEGRDYEVRALRLADAEPRWVDALPLGKEKTWADGRFPNWSCLCHPLKHKPDRPWLGDISDNVVEGFGHVNRVSFVETDGVLRPTRVPTFHQVAYDSKRGHLVYYAGGRTFAYDPKGRTWTDLKAAPPLACESLVWASMAYDPVGDQIVLFGGGMAMNPWGGAKTWVFDCEKNEWRRPELKNGVEPPPRCNAQLVYDSKNRGMVLFGGDAQDRLLADTWVLNPGKMAWEERKPVKSPPPPDRYGACFVEKHGLVFLVTPSSRRTSGAAWIYDVAADAWTPLKGRLPLSDMQWITCDYSPKDDVVVAASPGVGMWLYRLDPATAADPDPKRESARPGAWVWHSESRAQMESILAAPPPDRAATEKMLKELPVNTPVVVDYPGHLISKTWSGATIDTDRGVVIYTGGGHSGYSGNDIALYDVGANRWSFDNPPSFMPFLRGVNKVAACWDYRQRPQSQHTYRWYCYDPQSQMMVYCPRDDGLNQTQYVQLEADPAKAFLYDRGKHGSWTLVFDPVRNKCYPLFPGRPYRTVYPLALVGTPRGVYAKPGKELYHGEVTVKDDRPSIEWRLLDKDCPVGETEAQPLLYDGKRNRLLFVGWRKAGPPEIHERPLPDGSWRKLGTSGEVNYTREVVYDTANDCLLALSDEKLVTMDFAAHTWRTMAVEMPKGMYGTECAMVYDPVHQLCVALVPTGFSAKMQVVLFRYDPKTAKYK